MSRYDISWETKKLELKQPFTIARGTKKTVSNVFVKLSAGGVEGLGEAGPNIRYGEDAEKVMGFIKSLSKDFFDDVDTGEQLSDKLLSMPGQVKSAMAALEMAWLDHFGKTKGEPLWRLWDAPSNTTRPTSYTIGLDSREIIQEKVRAASEYPILKVKLGTDRDRDIISTIRQITNKPIRVDANEGWADIDTAKKQIAFLAEQNIEIVEQPMPSAMIEAMQELKKWSPIPLIADESFTGSENLDVITRAFDGINIKLMKMGSLVKARQVIAKARKRGLSVMVGCMIESSLANAAGALPGLWADYVDLDGHLLIKNDPGKGLTLDSDKCVVLNDRPGLGVSLNTH